MVFFPPIVVLVIFATTNALPLMETTNTATIKEPDGNSQTRSVPIINLPNDQSILENKRIDLPDVKSTPVEPIARTTEILSETPVVKSAIIEPAGKNDEILSGVPELISDVMLKNEPTTKIAEILMVQPDLKSESEATSVEPTVKSEEILNETPQLKTEMLEPNLKSAEVMPNLSDVKIVMDNPELILKSENVMNEAVKSAEILNEMAEGKSQVIEQDLMSDVNEPEPILKSAINVEPAVKTAENEMPEVKSNIKKPVLKSMIELLDVRGSFKEVSDKNEEMINEDPKMKSDVLEPVLKSTDISSESPIVKNVKPTEIEDDSILKSGSVLNEPVVKSAEIPEVKMQVLESTDVMSETPNVKNTEVLIEDDPILKSTNLMNEVPAVKTEEIPKEMEMLEPVLKSAEAMSEKKDVTSKLIEISPAMKSEPAAKVESADEMPEDPVPTVKNGPTLLILLLDSTRKSSENIEEAQNVKKMALEPNLKSAQIINVVPILKCMKVDDQMPTAKSLFFEQAFKSADIIPHFPAAKTLMPSHHPLFYRNGFMPYYMSPFLY